MENAVKSALGTKLFEPEGSRGGGCISQGAVYKTDSGLVFVKVNQKEKACSMFEGEMAGLNAILETSTIRVPKPIMVVNFTEESDGPGALVMESLRFSNANVQEKMGEQLAKLHLHNGLQLEKLKKDESRITHSSRSNEENEGAGTIRQFGFHKTTCCGYLPLDNSWNDDWTTFYIRQRLQPQVDKLIREGGSRDLIETWNKCFPIIERKLKKVQNLVPSLLHGDLWSGNFDACDGQPVIYDPGTFYGHSEFDLAIGYMFGGFRKAFYENYHRLIPKTEGFSERKDIYELFHHLNHWNHFGGSYKNSTLQLMNSIAHS